MMEIAICDDQEESALKLQSYVNTLAQQNEISVNIQVFDSAETLLQIFPAKLDLIFLDIQMPGMDGITAAKRIREFDRKVTLVFMTNYSQYAIEGYQVQAYRYLLKPISLQSFVQEIEPIFKELYRQVNPFLQIKNDRGLYKVSVSDITFVETTKNKNILIHTSNQKLLCYRTLGGIQEELTAYRCFSRCHTSFLVNLAHVSELLGNDIILHDGTILPVSKHRKKEVLQEFAHYVGRIL